MNADRVNALRCAVEILSGEGGGYTAEQKKAYKKTLWDMLAEEEKKDDQ